MKKRKGFVSNSSSQSFILKGKLISNVARSMLNTVVEDWLSYDDRDENRKSQKLYKKWKKNLEDGLKNSKVKNGKIGITLPSTNYETYIFKKDKDVYVSTANNHQWNYSEMGVATHPGDGADGGADDLIHKYIGEQNYFNVRNGLVHSKNKWERGDNFSDKTKEKCFNCKSYHGEYVMVGKKKICAECYKGVIGTKQTIGWPTEREEKKLRTLQKMLENRPSISNVINTLEL